MSEHFVRRGSAPLGLFSERSRTGGAKSHYAGKRNVSQAPASEPEEGGVQTRFKLFLPSSSSLMVPLFYSLYCSLPLSNCSCFFALPSKASGRQEVDLVTNRGQESARVSKVKERRFKSTILTKLTSHPWIERRVSVHSITVVSGRTWTTKSWT